MANRMSEAEYSSLRAEIATRIATIHTLENTSLVFSVSLWVIAFTIISSDNIITESVFASLRIPLALALLVIALIVNLVLSVKCNENNHQILSLSTYIQVFYELNSRFNSGIIDNLYLWETANQKINLFGKCKPIGNVIYTSFFNGSYVFMEIVTFIFGGVVIWNWEEMAGIRVFSLAILILVAAIFIVMTVKLVSSDLFTNKGRKKLLVCFIKLAIDTGVIEDDHVEEMLGERLKEKDKIIERLAELVLNG